MPRIDKVSLDNYYKQYPSQTPAVKRTEEEMPSFPVSEEKGVVYEPSVSKRSETQEKKASAVEKKQELGAINAEETERSIPELLKEVGVRILSFLRSILSSIWNGPASGNNEPAREIPEEAVSADLYQEEEKTADTAETTLDRIIAEHDLDQLVRYVTENGEKKPARSTDLLTIYNRYGRVNTIDPSDRKKILEGNFHDIKL